MKGCKVLADEEIKVILDDLKIRDRLLFLTCLTFGTRISEALALTMGDVSGNYLYIRSKKGSDNQSFPIPKSYKTLVNKLMQDYERRGFQVSNNTPLFLSQKGYNKAITRQLASFTIKKVVKKHNLDGKINTHSFRKSFVNKIYELTGYNIVETLLYSRHKSLVNLESYIKTSQQPLLVEQLSWA